MIGHNEQKKMLIESMKKLTGHVAGNLQRQHDIFQALSLHDFNKIISNLKDENQYLRRISALFLCQLMFDNAKNRAGVVTLLGLQPNYGRICLGGLPESIGKYPSTLKKCVELMRGQPQEGQDSKMCWIINLERKTLKIQLLDYKKYSSFTFIDPAKHIFGYTIFPKGDTRSTKKDDIKRHTIGVVEGKMFQNQFRRSVDHYKKIIDERQRSKQRVPIKNNLNMTMELHSSRKNSNTPTSIQYKNTLHSHRKTQYANTFELRNVTEPLKTKQQQRGYKPSQQMSPRVLLTESKQKINGSSTSRNEYKYHLDSERGSIRRSTGFTPTSARESGTREQQKFYRKVKQIIRK